MNDTIFALASARGRAGVAVIRVSGPQSDAALGTLSGTRSLPAYREMALRRLSDPRNGLPLDDALVVRFAGGASFTNEASAEIHCHGGPAVVSAILNTLESLPDIREADPGEFTRRAFNNGCLDLAQIEGLADLIASETDAQRRAALRQSDGSLGRTCDAWSDSLTTSLALLEATIDFSDEEIPDGTYGLVSDQVTPVRCAIEFLLSNSALADRFRDGWRIALVGAPNAGKSSIINALSKRDIAITSPIAGTTRDSLEVSLNLNGFPVTFIDTAGLRETTDEIETEGVARAQRSAETADLRVAIGAVDVPLSDDVRSLLKPTDLCIWNKCDLASAAADYDAAVSVKDGRGLNELIDLIADTLEFSDPSDASALLRRRHDAALRRAVQSLKMFEALADSPGSNVRDNPEIGAEYLRLARTELGSITGKVGVESLLDVIFSEFCLGK